MASKEREDRNCFEYIRYNLPIATPHASNLLVPTSKEGGYAQPSDRDYANVRQTTPE